MTITLWRCEDDYSLSTSGTTRCYQQFNSAGAFYRKSKRGLLMNTRHVKRWKKRIFTYNNILFIASGMVLILTILFLYPCAWILAVITGWIIVTYLVITALGMACNGKKEVE